MISIFGVQCFCMKCFDICGDSERRNVWTSGRTCFLGEDARYEDEPKGISARMVAELEKSS